VKGWKICQANGSPKQEGVAILISDKVDFKLILVKGTKDNILVKGSIHQTYMHPMSRHTISSNIL
jgi:hypothetical protein